MPSSSFAWHSRGAAAARGRIPDRIVFDKVVQVLVFGCDYARIADATCSATTFRRRRDEWIDAGVIEALHALALAAYNRMIGLALADVAIDCCITKAPCGGEVAGRSPVDRGYDSRATRKQLATRGLTDEIAAKGQPVPIAAERRWVVERTNAWSNAYKKLVRCTEHLAAPDLRPADVREER